MLGTAFAVVIAKQLYGGLGHNPFNPAMIGYVVLLISFPVQMTSWLPPHEIAAQIPGFMDALQVIFSGHTASGGDMNSLRMGIDGISQATPLDTFKTSLHAGHSAKEILQYPIYGGQLAGLGWQWVNLAWLAGGLFLLWQNHSLAYPGELPAKPCRLRHSRVDFLAGKPGIAANASAFRRHHARGVLYPYRSGDGIHHQPRTPDFRRAGRFTGVADPQLRRLSGRRRLCRAAGEYNRPID